MAAPVIKAVITKILIPPIRQFIMSCGTSRASNINPLRLFKGTSTSYASLTLQPSCRGRAAPKHANARTPPRFPVQEIPQLWEKSHSITHIHYVVNVGLPGRSRVSGSCPDSDYPDTRFSLRPPRQLFSGVSGHRRGPALERRRPPLESGRVMPGSPRSSAAGRTPRHRMTTPARSALERRSTPVDAGRAGPHREPSATIDASVPDFLSKRQSKELPDGGYSWEDGAGESDPPPRVVLVILLLSGGYHLCGGGAASAVPVIMAGLCGSCQSYQ